MEQVCPIYTAGLCVPALLLSGSCSQVQCVQLGCGHWYSPQALLQERQALADGLGRQVGRTSAAAVTFATRYKSLSLGLLHLMWETNYSRSYEAVHTAHPSASD